jgi:hypothetical protein
MEAGRIGEGKKKPFLNRKDKTESAEAPPVGRRRRVEVGREKTVDKTDLLMEAATAGSDRKPLH